MIELKLDPKWKWAAMDEDGVWNFFTSEPEIRGKAWFSSTEPSCGEELVCFALSSSCNWRDSLHEIVHQDGKVYLKKHVDIPVDGEPVLVGYSSPGEHRRYSAGKIDDKGRLECYRNGATIWSGNKEDLAAWKYWRRPTEEELRD